MGLLNVLGGLGAAIAAPFTGGTSLAWLPGVIGAGTAAADALTGAAKGSAAERGNVNQYAQDLNRAKASLYGTQQGGILRALENAEAGKLGRANLDLNRQSFALNAPTTRANQSVRGSALANAQDASLSGLPSRISVPAISGGLRPSVLGSDTRALGNEMMAKALRDQLVGDTFEDVPDTDFQSGLIAPPALDPYTQAGTGESLLSGAGTIGSILKAIELLTKKKPGDIEAGFEYPYTQYTPIIPGSQVDARP